MHFSFFLPPRYSVPGEAGDEAYAVINTGAAATTGGYLDISANGDGGAYGGDNYRTRMDSVA